MATKASFQLELQRPAERIELFPGCAIAFAFPCSAVESAGEVAPCCTPLGLAWRHTIIVNSPNITEAVIGNAENDV